MRAMKNYAGHRLSPWLGHLMVSRQETARPLLTPGEVMQLPPNDELVLVSGVAPIRARKARYFEDVRLAERVLAPPQTASGQSGTAPPDDWSGQFVPAAVGSGREVNTSGAARIDDPANAGIRREPELPEHEEIAPEQAKPAPEFVFSEEDPDDDAARARTLRQQAGGLARQAAMDSGDGMEL
jgi:type IV secretion system protein VirD4